MNAKIIMALALSLFAPWFGLNSVAQGGSGAGNAIGAIAAAANKFLVSLEDRQRGKVLFDFKDEAQRRRWSNFPNAMFKRAGLRMGDLTKPQRDAVLALLATALSPQGYEKVLQIMEGDEVLRKSGGETMFGREEYYVSFLPSNFDQ